MAVRPAATRAWTGPLAWSGLIALLVVACSIAGLVDPRVYAQETQNWTLQAQGQDIGNLLAGLVLVVTAIRYRRGSTRAGLLWLGTLLYLIYAFTIYAMAIHLNYLFLLYVAVLGLSSWAVVTHVGPVRRGALSYPTGRVRTVAAWTLIVTGVLFAALWLSELVPALVTGQPPASLTEAGLWVNPIHVIDLALVLPAFIATGVAALRQHQAGLFWLGPWLAFSVLMGSSIIAAMLLMTGAGESDAVPVAVMVSIVVLASLAACWAYLQRTTETRDGSGAAGDPSSSLPLVHHSQRC
ncbi:hypothetical protein [Ornithinimicrobium cryptoxanthini]|uniref:DUF998 domain-containing protein n=1 Tax=Ornithinimicrobium cryptoxanthini TaxID=2934161 RepID=A0ABY4YFX7_9MICO|nr:hypothetical protein [Ornithinimicrobium cryptoxanthini]USQ75638.1 hypothetical protein NF557_13605 [Ornithinimicrobium cryptoxanthini]